MHEVWTQSLWFLRSLLEWQSLFDILIVAFLIYEVLRLLRGTRAVQMAVGLGLIALLYEVSIWLGLSTLQWVLRNVVFYLGFGIIVLFQREIRAALLHFGRNLRMPLWHAMRRATAHEHHWYDDVVLAATSLASEKIGALLIFERDTGLKTYIESGIRLDARLTYDLLVTIFNPNTPLHDGAAIISDNRVAAASCFLPLTQNPRISRDLGTRHRAAIGITEDSDAFAVIVSEETGVVSFAIGGGVIRNLDGPKLRALILKAMEPWHSQEEHAAHEEDERRHVQELDEILAGNRAEPAAPHVPTESLRESSTL
ncbi:MAG TPA: diadenylate cyclase CdaA [Blastocatellia bacterium]|nr:diadenylate cyclase CdaA [Blastocatellia bacterium]